MDFTTLIWIVANISVLVVFFFLTSKYIKKKADKYKSLSDAIREAEVSNQQVEARLSEISQATLNKEKKLSQLKEAVAIHQREFQELDIATKNLQELSNNAEQLSEQLEQNKHALATIKDEIANYERASEIGEAKLHGVMAKIDLYSRLEEFVDYGHFEMPEYLYETGERFVAEIKVLREAQKSMIKVGDAVTINGNVSITGITSIDKGIIDGQKKMLLKAFNIECDMLISQVSPATFERTLSRIEKSANDLEKLVASKRCGLNNEYVKLKYEECRVQYQYTLKKKDELEEQRLIKEQMREEAKAEREYREALAAADREEKLYRELLKKAREELTGLTQEERALAEAKIASLEQQLAEAEAKEQRAKSLAEQTRRGHVYVISNVGSFGENIYKIGMTRRLDPMDRVKELGDASVPFSFDVHAIIFADDAPAMETALHREFNKNRVNAVNLRKEFFEVDLIKIREAVQKIGGSDVDFKTTIVADEFYESKRLRENILAR